MPDSSVMGSDQCARKAIKVYQAQSKSMAHVAGAIIHNISRYHEDATTTVYVRGTQFQHRHGPIKT
jgi:hypothetical protein